MGRLRVPGSNVRWLALGVVMALAMPVYDAVASHSPTVSAWSYTYRHLSGYAYSSDGLYLYLHTTAQLHGSVSASALPVDEAWAQHDGGAFGHYDLSVYDCRSGYSCQHVAGSGDLPPGSRVVREDRSYRVSFGSACGVVDVTFTPVEDPQARGWQAVQPLGMEAVADAHLYERTTLAGVVCGYSIPTEYQHGYHMIGNHSGAGVARPF